jgi:proteic killer suppression protein
MIKAFRHKGLKQLFETGRSRSVSADLTRRLIRQMDFLNRATSPSDMNLPGYRLHELKGTRKGTWSVSVSGNWRLTFTFEGADVRDVDLEDYH